MSFYFESYMNGWLVPLYVFVLQDLAYMVWFCNHLLLVWTKFEHTILERAYICI